MRCMAANPASVFDIGCGEGWLAKELSDHRSFCKRSGYNTGIDRKGKRKSKREIFLLLLMKISMLHVQDPLVKIV